MEEQQAGMPVDGQTLRKFMELLRRYKAGKSRILRQLKQDNAIGLPGKLHLFRSRQILLPGALQIKPVKIRNLHFFIRR